MQSDGRLRGCPACSVTWFGADDRCWVCGGTADGPVVLLPPAGAQTWSPACCLETAEDEETAAFVRRMVSPAADIVEAAPLLP